MRTFFRRLALFSIVSALPSPTFAGDKELVIDAVDLAPIEVRDDEPKPGKWWLNRDATEWKASNGTILMTGEPSGKTGQDGLHKVTPADRFVSHRVPSFEFDPKVHGWHRIYVGLYHQAEKPESRLLMKRRARWQKCIGELLTLPGTQFVSNSLWHRCHIPIAAGWAGLRMFVWFR
jgi:hypothetical protein